MVWLRSYRKRQSWYLNRGLLILCHYAGVGTQVVMVSEDGISSSPAAARRQNPRHTDSFNKCLLNTCNVPGTKLGTWDPQSEENRCGSCCHRAYILVEETDTKLCRKIALSTPAQLKCAPEGALAGRLETSSSSSVAPNALCEVDRGFPPVKFASMWSSHVFSGPYSQPVSQVVNDFLNDYPG